jgi:hypothetical protein
MFTTYCADDENLFLNAAHESASAPERLAGYLVEQPHPKKKETWMVPLWRFLRDMEMRNYYMKKTPTSAVMQSYTKNLRLPNHKKLLSKVYGLSLPQVLQLEYYLNEHKMRLLCAGKNSVPKDENGNDMPSYIHLRDEVPEDEEEEEEEESDDEE